MPFIGIIAKENDTNFIKNKINKFSKRKLDIIKINKESVQNLRNIYFDIIVISDDFEKLLEISKYLEEILKRTKYLIINSDIIKEVINLTKSKVITYGLKYKSMITVSSIKKEKILICLQEPIEDINKKLIENQEFIVEISKMGLNKIYNSMILFAILLIYGQKLEKI